MNRRNHRLIAALISVLGLISCEKGTAPSVEAKKQTWTLVAETDDKKGRWYVDFDSMKIESPEIYSYLELYDSDDTFTAEKNDNRLVKSIVDEKLVNCAEGRTKKGNYTAYIENMGRGISFSGESSLKIWLGTVPDTPSRKMVIMLCDPEERKSLNKTS